MQLENRVHYIYIYDENEENTYEFTYEYMNLEFVVENVFEYLMAIHISLLFLRSF